MNCARLAFFPRDGLFLKDGRGWYTSDIGRSHAHPWPQPPTLRGALRAAAGRALNDARRPLARHDWEGATQGLHLRRVLTVRRPLDEGLAASHRMWPAPADALVLTAEPYLTPLAPRPPEGGAHPTLGARGDPDAIERLWRPARPAGKPLRGPTFWAEPEFITWLRGGQVARHAPDEVRSLAPSSRLDFHVTIEPGSGAATDGLLFSGDVVESLTAEHHEWGLAAEFTLPPGLSALSAAPLPLGGRRRLAHALAAHEALFAAPTFAEGADGLRVILVTPAEFERGWLPDAFEPTSSADYGPYRGRLPGLDVDLFLCAAIVPRPHHFSGWNVAQRRPRPTRRLVPAGAVYFFQRADRRPFTPDQLRACWFSLWGQSTEDGLGLIVAGVWHPSTEDSA
jgi:CRISPR-associated protein Cmr3